MFLQSCVKKIAKTKFWRFRLQLPTHFAILQFFVFDTFYLQCCNVFSPAVFLSSGFIPLLFREKVCVCTLCCNLPVYTVTRYTLHCACCKNTVGKLFHYCVLTWSPLPLLRQTGFIPLLFREKVCVCTRYCKLPAYTVTRYTLHCAYHGNNRKECRNTVFAKCPLAKTIRDLMSFPPFPPRQRILCLPRRTRQNTNCLFGH